MNLISTAPAPVATLPTGTAGPPAEGTDARLADAFSALVDALVAQIDAEAEPAEASEDATAEVGEDAETAQDPATAATAMAAGPVLLVWPPQSLPATQPGADSGPAPADAAAGPAGVATVATAQIATTQIPTTQVDLEDALVAAPEAEAAPAAAVPTTTDAVEQAGTDGVDTAPATTEQDASTDGQSGPGSTSDAGPEAVPPESGPLAPTGSTSFAVVDDGDVPPAGNLGVSGPAPVRPVGEVAATAASPAARTPAPSLPDQLVEVIGPLRQAPDGTHRLSVHLRPDELGEVLVDVRVRGNEVNLTIRAELAGTADLLRDAVGELRAELETAGFRSGDVDVSSHSDRRATQERRPAGAMPAGDAGASGLDGHEDANPTPTPTPASTAASSGLDLRL